MQSTGLNLRHVADQDAAVCLHAVRQNGMALRFIFRPSRRVQQPDVRASGDALQYLSGASEENAMPAASRHGRNGSSLRLVRQRREALCMAPRRHPRLSSGRPGTGCHEQGRPGREKRFA
ncbi:hypothetical protein [Mailhella massiliensis]|uniref:hypothetical protein n=1 Tax=Mailhella massiliensis TaxID=1903261 RepID=UPI0011854CEC|nr:hypothetical protein [Mailhella massiliensis]